MKIYKPNTASISLPRGVYYADSDGIIEVPDTNMTSAVWGQGFVLAKGREAQLASERAALKEADDAKAKAAAKAEAKAVPAETAKPAPVK